MQQVLEPIIKPTFEALRDWGVNPLFMEDGASIHGCRDKTNLRLWKLEHGITTMWWPPSSPDFNPIEKVWRILKQRIKHRPQQPRTMAELRQAILEEWERLDPNDWGKHIESMPDRMKEGRIRKGVQTRY